MEIFSYKWAKSPWGGNFHIKGTGVLIRKSSRYLKLNTLGGTPERDDEYPRPFYVGVPPGQKGDNKYLLYKLY